MSLFSYKVNSELVKLKSRFLLSADLRPRRDSQREKRKHSGLNLVPTWRLRAFRARNDAPGRESASAHRSARTDLLASSPLLLLFILLILLFIRALCPQPRAFTPA